MIPIPPPIRLVPLLLALAVALPSGAAEVQPPHISVYGTAVKEVPPDEMHWTLNVTTRGPDVAAVAEMHDRKVAGVIRFLKENSVDEDKIQTSRISLSENWVYRDRSREKDGYIGTTTVLFESDDLDKYRDFWMGLAELPDVSVNGVIFETSERIRHQNQTRIEALRLAREKAQAMALALDTSIGNPISIEEIPSGPD